MIILADIMAHVFLYEDWARVPRWEQAASIACLLIMITMVAALLMLWVAAQII